MRPATYTIKPDGTVCIYRDHTEFLTAPRIDTELAEGRRLLRRFEIYNSLGQLVNWSGFRPFLAAKPARSDTLVINANPYAGDGIKAPGTSVPPNVIEIDVPATGLALSPGVRSLRYDIKVIPCYNPYGAVQPKDITIDVLNLDGGSTFTYTGGGGDPFLAYNPGADVLISDFEDDESVSSIYKVDSVAANILRTTVSVGGADNPDDGKVRFLYVQPPPLPDYAFTLCWGKLHTRARVTA